VVVVWKATDTKAGRHQRRVVDIRYGVIRRPMEFVGGHSVVQQELYHIKPTLRWVSGGSELKPEQSSVEQGTPIALVSDATQVFLGGGGIAKKVYELQCILPSFYQNRQIAGTTGT